MRKFKFSLESYLKTKEIEKDKKIEELNIIRNKLYKANEYMEKIEKEKIDIENKIKVLMKTGLSSITYSQFSECINEKIICFKEAQEERDEIQKLLFVRQDELKKILGEVKSIEKLKDKQFAEYTELLKKETERITEDFLNTNKKNDDSKLKF